MASNALTYVTGFERGLLADGRLVDHLDRLDQLRAFDRVVRADASRWLSPLSRVKAGVQRVVDERGLARARDAGHDRDHVERERRVDALQVVLSAPPLIVMTAAQASTARRDSGTGIDSSGPTGRRRSGWSHRP